MLVAAGHAKGDIPAALAREQTRHPGLTFTYARTLGPHPLLIDLLASASPLPAATPPAVLVVGRGSTDPDANADVVKTARLLWEGRDYPLAETAFVSLARPDVTEGLERCRLLGARRIVVAPLLPVPRRAAGPGGRAGRASTPRPIPSWTSRSPTCSVTATSSPRWSSSATARRCPGTSG